MRLTRCGDLRLLPLTGHWYRGMRLQHWKTRLSTRHTVTLASRFSAASKDRPGPRVLYLGENHQVVIYEVGALMGAPSAPVPTPAASWVIISLEVRLDNVVDLCDRGQQRMLSTNLQELTGNWLNSAEVLPTQRLGAALFEVPGLEGMVVPSARPGGGRNLVIFPDKLGPRSSIVFRNELNRKVEALA